MPIPWCKKLTILIYIYCAYPSEERIGGRMGILLNWWSRLPRSRRKALWDCHAARRCRSLAQGNSSPFFNNLLLKLGKSHNTQRPYMVTEMPLKLDRLEADLNNYKTLCLDYRLLGRSYICLQLFLGQITSKKSVFMFMRNYKENLSL